jgi:hypothetical protein
MGALPAYFQTGTFPLPSSGSAFDVGADGRALVVREDGVVLKQNTSYGPTYSVVGSLPSGLVPGFGAGFVRISPDGARFAVGDNGTVNQMWIVPTASLNTAGPTAVQTITVPNFDAAWTSSGKMYVNGSPSFGTPPSLYRVDVTSGAAAPVVTGIGDGSGGVAAHGGRVYTAIGYDAAPGGPMSGLTRSFDVATLDASAGTVAFSTGVFAAQANSGSSLAFEANGNLVIAGNGGVAVFDLATLQRYDLPGLSAFGFYSATYDAPTQEILVRDFGATTVLRYGVLPAPGSLVPLVGASLIALRRRRHA